MSLLKGEGEQQREGNKEKRGREEGKKGKDEPPRKRAAVQKFKSFLKILTMSDRQTIYEETGQAINLDFLIRESDVPKIILARILLYMTPREVVELRLVSKELRNVIDTYKISEILEQKGVIYQITHNPKRYINSVSHELDGIVLAVTTHGTESDMEAYMTNDGVIHIDFDEWTPEVRNLDSSTLCSYTNTIGYSAAIMSDNHVYIWQIDTNPYVLDELILGKPRKIMAKFNQLFVLTTDGVIFIFKEDPRPHSRLQFPIPACFIINLEIINSTTFLYVKLENGRKFLNILYPNNMNYDYETRLINTELPVVKLYTNGTYVAYTSDNGELFLGFYDETRQSIDFRRIMSIPPVTKVVFSGPPEASTVIVRTTTNELYSNGTYRNDETGDLKFFPPLKIQPYDKDFRFRFELVNGINETVGRILDVAANEGGYVYVVADSTEIRKLPQIESQVQECHTNDCLKLTISKCNACGIPICGQCFKDHEK